MKGDDDEGEAEQDVEVDADDEELRVAVYQDSTNGGRKGGRKGKKTV